MSHRITIHRIARRVTSTLLMFALAAVVVPAPAAADEWLERAQRDMGLVSGNKAVEPVLFPALIGMDMWPFNSNISSDPLASMVYQPRGHSERQKLIDWVMKPNQQAVLEAVRTVSDPDENYMFSLQIGKDKVSPEWADSSLYIESGYENLLFDAEYNYLLRMNYRLLALMYANGIAKAEAGEGDEALMDYAAFISLYRLLLERPTVYEKRAALDLIELTSELMADLVYQYTRPGDTSFTPRGIADAILETDDAVQRFRFRDFSLPTVTEYEVRQAFEWATQGGMRVDPNRFAALMAIRAPQVEGLSRFGVFSAQKSMGALQRDRVDYERKIRDVFTDYNRRWSYNNLHDPLLRNRSAGSTTFVDYELIAVFVESRHSALFERRLEMLTALGGMRCALGIVAFHLENRNLPGRLVSIQPTFVRSLSNNVDHMNYNQRIRQPEPLRYWVPMRDETFGVRETPTPYVIRAVFDQFGRATSGRGIPAASRATDLAGAIPFPGFGERGQQFAEADAGFDPSQLAGLVGIDFDAFTGIRAQQTAQAFIIDGALPRFGLPDDAHASLEDYLSGDSDTFDYNALRSVIKQSLTNNAPTEQDANQISVLLAGLVFLGYSPDNMAQKVREELQKAIDENIPDAPSGIDPSLFDDDPLAKAMMSGDPDQVSQLIVGKSQAQLADYMADVVGRIAAVPSFREAMRMATQGEFLSSSEFVRMMRDFVDALVVPEVMNPLRDMLIHFRTSPIGEAIREMSSDVSTGTPVTFALDENSFLLYSVGDNGIDGRAALADDGTAGDRLFWPPYPSLYRIYQNR